MFVERNLKRRYLVLCQFMFPGGHGFMNYSGIMISVDAPGDIRTEFESVCKLHGYRNAQLTSFLPQKNTIFKAKKSDFAW